MVEQSRDLRVKAGVLDIMYKLSWTRNLASLVLIVVISFTYWGEVENAVLFFWVGFGGCIFLMRQIIFTFYKRCSKDSLTSVRLWENLYSVGLVATAVLWFYLCVFITPSKNTGLLLVTFLFVTGIASAGYFSSCLLPRGSFLFLFILVLGMGIRLISDFPQYWETILFILTFYVYFIRAIAIHSRNALTENIRLYYEKRDLAKELDVARKYAEQASLEKSRFLGMTSHEIRNSVNGIVGIMQVMDDSMQSEEGRDRLETMKKSSSDILNHLNNLLDLNKIEEGKLTLENRVFDWRETIEDAVKLFEGSASQKRLFLKFESVQGGQRYVRGDSTRFGQILKNLLSNAVKFTTEGGITLQASYEVVGDEHVRLKVEVRDTGVGISPEMQKSLFLPFVQEDDSVHRLYGGSGLGLSICEQIAERMETKIRVSSEKGKGSIFGFDPLFEIADEQSREVHKLADLTTKDITGKRCLVVQDDVTSQKVGRLLLEKLGMQVDVVDSGEACLDMLGVNPYDYIFMDIRMAGMSGIEATQKIRRMRLGFSQPKIIALTGSVMVSERAAYAEAGMDGCLAKPLMIAELKSVFE